MPKLPHPFALPTNLASDLIRVRHYWDGLKRGENEIPFWDDINMSSLPELDGRLMLVDTFVGPQRFRINTVGNEIRDWYGADLVGKFVDEMDPKEPLEYLAAQASTTVEARAPTYYQNQFARLLLPMWGGGHVAMLLGAFVRL